MRKLLFIAALLFFAGTGFSYNPPTMDTTYNWGPLTWYPDSAKDRIFKVPFDSGVVCTLSDCCFNRPNSHHKGYEYDFPHPWGTPVLACKEGWVERFNNNKTDPNGGDNQIIVRNKDISVNGKTYSTNTWYLHVQIDSAVVQLNEHVMQGQLLSYIGQEGMWDHVHVEMQIMGGKQGVGCFVCSPWTGFTPAVPTGIESVPAPFVENTMHPDGVLWRGDIVTSQNKRYTAGVEQHIPGPAPKPGLMLTATPNPATADVRFWAYADLSLGKSRLVVYAGNGKKVADLSNRLMQDADVLWSTAGLPRGIYLAKLTAGNKTVARRLALVR
jgi:hypothetical protein